MVKRLKSMNPMLLNLTLACLIYGVIGELLIFFVLPLIYQGSIAKSAIGYALGVLMMIIFTVHMYLGLEDSLKLGEIEAQRNTVKRYIFRFVTVIAIFIIILLTGFCNPIAMVCGMFSLKVAAYLQPITDKFLVSKIIS